MNGEKANEKRGCDFQEGPSELLHKSSSDEGQRMMADVICLERFDHPSGQVKEKALRWEKEPSPPRATGLSSTISWPFEMQPSVSPDVEPAATEPGFSSLHLHPGRWYNLQAHPDQSVSHGSSQTEGGSAAGEVCPREQRRSLLRYFSMYFDNYI